VSLIDRLAGALEQRTSRRGFLARTAVVGSALAVDPLGYALHPGTAYAAVCRCASPGCRCGSMCCDGYSEFCCTLTGSNTCPTGTIPGGWWRADGSPFCGGGPRYYIDCHGMCATPGGPGACTDDGLSCGCAGGDCGRRATGCVTFRYGQCHQEVPRVGRIACRVVTCTPAYLLDNACSTQVLMDNGTAGHNNPCLQAPEVVRRSYSGAVTPDGAGLWLASLSGAVFTTGTAAAHGGLDGADLPAPVTGIAPTPDGAGYWLATADGGVFTFGSAAFFGSMGGRRLVAPVVGITATPDGQGYWLLASDGGVFCFGNAPFHGSIGGHPLNLPMVGMAPTPDARGYWTVASDGGVFTFGAATFFGSAGGKPLTSLVAGIVPTPTSAGYWLWCQDGSVHAFGDAAALGGYPDIPAPDPALPAGGFGAFYAFAPSLPAPSAPETTSAGPTGYALWAASPGWVSPATQRYAFTRPTVAAASP
jgi:hypothetical protein